MSENKKDYQESVDTLITFGEEGLTARKDDPRTQKFVKNKEKELEERSLFEGINLNGKREEDESYEDYKHRQKINKTLLKMYKAYGNEKCWEMYPNGFKSALDQAEEEFKKSQQPQFTATTPDGKQIPVTIKNDNDGSDS